MNSIPFDYPLVFEPSRHPRIWGEESWLLSAHPSCPGVVANGPLKGRTLDALLPGFPVLVKEITANQWLSVQVHPGEETCRVTGGEPKSEMWRVLSPGPILAGFRSGTARADVERALAEGGVERLLEFFGTKRGDIFDIPAGLVHALGAGIRVFEVQQSSDTTFRFYDWDRTDGDGRKRELHIEKSLDAVDWNAPAAKSVKAAEIKKFAFSDETLDGTGEIDTAGDFLFLYCASGSLTLPGLDLAPGRGVLLPPGMRVSVRASRAETLSVRVPRDAAKPAAGASA